MNPESIFSETEYLGSVNLRMTEIHSREKQNERKLEWQLNIGIKITFVLKVLELRIFFPK